MALGISVADVMSKPAETVSPDTSVRDVAGRFQREAIGSLVVVDDEEPTGIVTDVDLIRVLANGVNPETATVADVMSAPVLTIEHNAPVVTAAEQFVEHDVTKLPVLEESELVGVVTTTDLGTYIPQTLHRQWLRRQTSEREPQFVVRPETTYEREGWHFETWTGAAEGIQVGDRVEFSKVLDDDDVRAFAEASGDTNRLHLDDEFAAATRFGGRIVHGTLIGGLISAALARLPGLTIYLSQDLSFQSPVSVGEKLTAVCEVIEDLGRDRYVLMTDVLDDDGEPIIEGEAVVLIDELPDFAQPKREPVEKA